MIFTQIRQAMLPDQRVPFLSMLVAAVILLGLAIQPVQAAGSSSGYDSDDGGDRFAEVNEALGAENYGGAIELLETMQAESPEDADVYNLLGFSNRKLGNFDVAYDHYQKALEIDPEHIRAHEYLGELYLQTDRLAEAEKQLETIDGLCSLFCKEKRMLKKAIKQYKAENK